MFNIKTTVIKTNEYALLTHGVHHKKIICWKNQQINYPKILFDAATTEEFFENEQVDYKSLQKLHDSLCQFTIENKNGTAWAKITKEGNVLTGGDKQEGGDSNHVQTQCVFFCF